jgi:hypothetical protein
MESAEAGGGAPVVQRAVYINEPSAYVHQRLMLAFQKR